MGFCEILTIIFLILKLTGIVSWAWFWVFFPEILALSFYALIVLLMIIGCFAAFREVIKKDN
jgi:hypothetical protein